MRFIFVCISADTLVLCVLTLYNLLYEILFSTCYQCMYCCEHSIISISGQNKNEFHNKKKRKIPYILVPTVKMTTSLSKVMK